MILLMLEKYFGFIRFSLGIEDIHESCLSGIDWYGLFKFAQEHTIVGVLFEGLQKVPKEFAPDRDLVMKWVGTAEQIRRNNLRLNKASASIYKILSDDGWHSCILKGQGNALMYPNPYSRTSGDVDVWITGASRDKILDYVTGKFDVGKIIVYHTEFDYEGVPIEVHYKPSVASNPFFNKRMQIWFNSKAATQCANIVDLPGGVGRISVPTAEFNVVYQLFHIYHHFFEECIGLRQIIDYYYVLTSSEHDADAFRRDVKHMGLYPFSCAVMWLMQECFHVSSDRLLVPPDEQRGRILLSEILNAGNFGRYDSKYGDISHTKGLRRFLTKARRSMKFAKYYPYEAFCEPAFRLWHYFWRKKFRENDGK